MNNFEKKLLSTVCAVSMTMSSVGAFNVLAAEYDYSIGKIEIGGEDLSGGVQMSIADIKLAIAELKVNLDNYSSNKAAVISLAKSINLLSEEDMGQLDAPIDEEDSASDTYWKRFKDATFAVEAGPVYDAFNNADALNDTITSENYQNYYYDIVDLSEMYDTLSANAQKKLADDQPLLAKWWTAYDACTTYDSAARERCTDDLAYLFQSTENITISNYSKVLDNFNIAKSQYETLLPEQQVKVQQALENDDALVAALIAVGFDAEENDIASFIISLSAVRLNDFNKTTMDAIRDLVNYAAITFENCDEVNTNALEAKRQYDIAKELGDNFVDDALKTKIDNYIAASGYFIKAAGLNKDFSPGSYIADKTAIDNLIKYYEDDMSNEQQGLAKKAKDYVDGLNNSWAAYRQKLIDNAIGKINAIPEFDHSTWKDRAAWQNIRNKIDEAAAAINDVAEIDRDEITNLDDFKNKEKEYKQIEEDYAAVNAVIAAIKAIGTVGDLPSDSITLSSEAAIKNAENLYADLTDEQKDLVVDEYADLQKARSEYDELSAAADEVKDNLKLFNDLLRALNYSYTNIPTEEDKNEVTAAYDAAYNCAYDAANYGTKLNSLITAQEVDKKDKLEKFYQYVNALCNAGKDLVDDVNAVLDMLGIGADDTDDIKAAIEDVAVNGDLEALNVLIENTAQVCITYIESKTKAENIIGAIPVNKTPYADYEKYNNLFTLIMKEYDYTDLDEQLKKVDHWAKEAHELFENIEDHCISGIAEGIWNRLNEDQDDFNNTQKLYLMTKHANEFSEFVYAGFRIDQYKEAADYIEFVQKIRERLNIIDAVREQGEDKYKAELDDLDRIVIFAIDQYKGTIKPAIKDIAGVGEAYAECNDMSKEIADRLVAYAFDNAVAAKFAGYTLPVSDFADSWNNNFKELLDNYNSLTEGQRSYVTKYDELCAKEIELAEAAIKQVVAAADYTTAFGRVEDARNCYDLIYSDKEKVGNYSDLVYYETAKAYYDDVADLAAAFDKDNYASFKQKIEVLYNRYNDWKENEEEELPIANKAVDDSCNTLNKLSAVIVSCMIGDLLKPDEIEALTDATALAIVKESLDEVAEAYDRLLPEYKLTVEGYSRYELDVEAYNTAMTAYNRNKAVVVDALIEAIGYYDDNYSITMNHKNFYDYDESITAAREAYDELNEDQIVYVTLTSVLEAAEKDYKMWSDAEAEANVVKDMIAALPDAEEVNDNNYDKVKADWTNTDEAMKDLSDKATLFITAEEREKENSIKDKLDFISAYKEVIDLIEENIYKSEVYNNIVNNHAINMEYAYIIADIENLYNELSRDQKLCVVNYVGLFEAKKTYNENIDNAILEIQRGIDEIKIDAIVSKDILLKGMLDDLQMLIDMLSEENRARIGSDANDTVYATRLEKLAAAVEKYNNLYDADSVIKLINELGDIDELTEENFADKEAAVEAAENAYASLTNDEKLNVTNYPLLTLWREAIDSFAVDHRGDVNFDGVVDISDIYKMVQFALHKETPTDEEFERANLVKESGSEEESIDLFDILAAIDLIQF